ncbi:tumor necrosis factor receptor superfamily member 13B [Pseudorasbora parva]|uniref:tumor necrosis factor receptor superfamily member 13B n=1 Tax=Pseudorasbora parva TaxID=51549 RepID=UPI00351E935A
MTQRCGDGQFLDSLVRECVSCSLVCHRPPVPARCSEYCVAWSCKAVSGQFYDRLLKKCLKCSELCGSHPSTCSDACKNAVSVTQRPVSVSAVPLVTSRGRAVGRSALYSQALLYSLLGVCVAVLMFTLTAAVLLLLQRAKHQPKPQQQPDNRRPQNNKHGQSSKDSLVAGADEVCQDQDRPRATETCIYCFSECEPHTLYQQAREPLHTHSDKSRPFRIICSPTQTSM